MSKCSIYGTKYLSGHNVSHANNKTKRVFNVNIQKFSYFSDLLGKKISYKISVKAHKDIIKKGGIDNFILKTNSKLVTNKIILLKTKMKKKLAEKNNITNI